MKTKVTLWMRYKLIVATTFRDSSIPLPSKLLVVSIGWVFAMGAPERGFLDEYYKVFPGEKK